MPDYDFYVNQYLGNAINEKNFPRLVSRARAFLNKYECQGDDESMKMAVCAVAEGWQKHEKGESDGLSAQTVGSWSKVYAKSSKDASKSANDKLLEMAGVYVTCRAVRWV